jgi:hypothetical protein
MRSSSVPRSARATRRLLAFASLASLARTGLA